MKHHVILFVGLRGRATRYYLGTLSYVRNECLMSMLDLVCKSGKIEQTRTDFIVGCSIIVEKVNNGPTWLLAYVQPNINRR